MKRKGWHTVLTKKEDVIVVKIALLLRELDYDTQRRDVLTKALRFNNDFSTLVARP